MAVNASRGLSALLRESTRSEHTNTESSSFQQRLFQGRLPAAAYGAYLCQLLFVHRRLEELLRQHREGDEALAHVVMDWQFREQDLTSDLDSLGFAWRECSPNSAALSLIRSLDESSAERPQALLGSHYVLEGSKNGGKLLAETVRRVYSLPTDRGAAYLDPYGKEQPQRWRFFKERLDELSLSDEHKEAIVGAAKSMFRGIDAIGTEIILEFPEQNHGAEPQSHK